MPNLEAKQVVVNEIKDKLENAQGVVLVNARGVTVAQDTEIRRSFREAGVYYKVYKNTMINLAIKGTAYESLSEHLSGPTAMAISYEDSTAGARVLNKYLSDVEALELKGGVVEGTYYGAEDIARIGKIPSRNELLSRLLGSFKSPMSSFARVVSEIAKKGPAAAAEEPSAKAEPEAAPEAEKTEAPAES